MCTAGRLQAAVKKHDSQTDLLMEIILEAENIKLFEAVYLYISNW